MTRRRCAIRFVKLALMVLHEQRQGALSRVAGYVAQLPQHIDTPLHWTPDERAQLQYPHLEAEVRNAEAVSEAWHRPRMVWGIRALHITGLIGAFLDQNPGLKVSITW